MTYRFSVLLTALVRMWRGWRILVPAVVVNAGLQGLLLLPGTMPYLGLWFAVPAVLSLLALVVSYALIAAAMLDAATGRVAVRRSVRVAQTRFLPLLGWSAALLIVVTISFALYVIPGFVVLAVTPYVLLAVVDGQRNPLAVNFRLIAARWVRWIVTVVAMAIICLVLWLFATVTGFFVTGAPAGAIAWLVLGLAAAWFTCAWALVYRSIYSAANSTAESATAMTDQRPSA